LPVTGTPIWEGMPEGAIVTTFLADRDGAELEGALRGAWDFIRRMGRYTPRTVNALVNLADRAEGRRINGRPMRTEEAPIVIRMELPYRYDEDTECKHGGTIGVAVLLPEGDDRVLVAVHKDSRRKGVGRELMHRAVAGAERRETSPVTWVAADNADSQMFLLALGWRPVSLNGAGAVCYSQRQADAVEIGRDDIESDVAAWALSEPAPPPALRRRTTLRYEDAE
jgi:GNAT superfamily N-acetyltransferase